MTISEADREESNIRRLNNSFTEVIARQLHRFENADNDEGWLHRYQNDHIFRMKVKNTVTRLIQVLNP